MPLDVRRIFMALSESITCRYAVETGRPPKAHRLRSDPASRLQANLAGEVGIAVFRTAFDGWVTMGSAPELTRAAT
jgi:hypothetical protein